jgi:hypothetical protein
MAASGWRGLAAAAAILGAMAAGGAEGRKTMTALYSLDRAKMPAVEGQVLPLERVTFPSVLPIFEVGRPRTVVTNAVDNGIGLFHLEGRAARFELVDQGFKKYVWGGSMVFPPLFSKDLVGYSQTRGFLLYDMRQKAFKDLTIGRHPEIDIQDVVAIDGEKQLFLFLLRYVLGMDRTAYHLALFDLSGAEPREVADRKLAGETRPWLGRTTFLVEGDGPEQRLVALGDGLRPVEHPLQAVYAPGRPGRYLTTPGVHPSLPFAIYDEQPAPVAIPTGTWLASWREPGKPPVAAKLFGGEGATLLRFSPDGGWAIFIDQAAKPYAYFAMKVDPALPNFLGPPVLLKGGDPIPLETNGRCAWASEPTAWVCSYMDEASSGVPGGKPRYQHRLVKWTLP